MIIIYILFTRKLGHCKNLTLTRDLINQIPDSGLKSALPSLGFGQQFQAFGLQGIENMGLPETGDIIVKKNNIPHIVTQWGKSG